MSETNVTGKWTEMVKLSNKKDKQVTQKTVLILGRLFKNNGNA